MAPRWPGAEPAPRFRGAHGPPGAGGGADRALTGRLLGGVPRRYFERPVPVRLIHADEGPGETAGRITGHHEQDGMTLLNLEAAGRCRRGASASSTSAPSERSTACCTSRRRTTWGGCARDPQRPAALSGAGTRADVAGVFTRCEEVGLIGATLVARQGLLPPQTVVVSLETSRALPGAEIGGGPVIRVGDATMAFHPQGEALLRRARALLLERDPGARIQRQLMSGGTCEAVAYSLAGYVTTGVAFPLGNYHNAGPDGTIGPEYIHRADLETGADLLVACAECVATGDAPDPVEARLNQRADQGAERLQALGGGLAPGLTRPHTLREIRRRAGLPRQRGPDGVVEAGPHLSHRPRRAVLAAGMDAVGQQDGEDPRHRVEQERRPGIAGVSVGLRGAEVGRDPEGIRLQHPPQAPPVSPSLTRAGP